MPFGPTGYEPARRGEIRLLDTAGGEYVALKAPGTVPTNVTLTLPDSYGSTDDVLTCADGVGTLEWSSGGGGGLDASDIIQAAMFS